MKSLLNISFFKVLLLLLVAIVTVNSVNQYLSLELDSIELMEVDEEVDFEEEALELDFMAFKTFCFSNYYSYLENKYYSYRFSVISYDLSTETPPPNYV